MKWDDVDQRLRDQIERGVPAIMRINRHETFADWLEVGMALAAMQKAAQDFSGGNATTGKGYNLAYKVIAERVPDLAAIDKATRSHAIWMASNREAIAAWHGRLPTNIRQQVNHPTTIRRRYDRDTKPPKADGTTAATGNRKDAAILRLQEDLDAANAELRQLRRGQDNLTEGRDWSWSDNPDAIARVWLQLQPTKAKQIASKVLELAKSTKAPPKVKRGAVA
jgi:hypothetical protein